MPHASPPQERLVLRCAWCDLYRIGGGWLPEAALGPDGRRDLPVTHGICPPCAAAVQAERREPAEHGARNLRGVPVAAPLTVRAPAL